MFLFLIPIFEHFCQMYEKVMVMFIDEGFFWELAQFDSELKELMVIFAVEEVENIWDCAGVEAKGFEIVDDSVILLGE